MLKTFPRGAGAHGGKGPTRGLPLKEMPAPAKLFIALGGHIGAPAEVVLEPGAIVKKGTLIGKAAAHVSANVFSPVSGVFTGVVERKNANGVMGKYAAVENDFTNAEERLPVLYKPSAEQIAERMLGAGIVGMGGAGFPAHVKYSPPKDKKIDLLIINAAECEPFITCDERIMLEKTAEFLEGVELLAAALNLKEAHIGLEANKPDAAAAILKAISQRYAGRIFLHMLKAKYPQGAEKQLIYAVSRRKVPARGLPMDVGVIVSNVQTAFAVYEAVSLGVPSYRRALTVSGGAIKEPSNLWVSVGTPFADIIAFCGGETDEGAAKLLDGGPMMGNAVFNDKVTVKKTTSCILLLTKAESFKGLTGPCINCGKCAAACPMFLMPMYIDRDALTGDFRGAEKYGAKDCIECGCCSYVCPAKRPMVQSIRMAKSKIKALEAGKGEVKK